MNKNGFVSLIGIIIIIIITTIILNNIDIIPKKHTILKSDFTKKSLHEISIDFLKLFEINDGKEYEKLRKFIIENVLFSKFKTKKYNISEIFIEWIKKTYIEDIMLNKSLQEGEVDIEISVKEEEIELKSLANINYINSYFTKKPYIEEDLEMLKKNIESYGYKYINDKDLLSNENLSKRSLVLSKYTESNTLSDKYSMKSFKDEPVYIVLNEKDSELSIDRTSIKGTPLNLEGVIYINGDLKIYDEFNFKGILIVNGNVVFGKNGRLKIQGFFNKDIYNDRLVYHYDYDNVIKYGIYIPGFIRFKILNIKRT